MSKAIKHMIVVVFMLFVFLAVLFSVLHLYVSSQDTKPIPTVLNIVDQWELVDTDNEPCGPFSYYVNPDPMSRYTVAYTHTCVLYHNTISQYGFLDTGRLREFDVDIDGRVEEFYRSMPDLVKQLKGYLIPIGTPI